MEGNRKREKALQKEAALIQKETLRQEQAARNAKPAQWKQELQRRIPTKVYSGLESAFCKGFSLVFQQGSAVIEKSFSKEEVRADHTIRAFALELKGGRKEWKQMHRGAKSADLRNIAITTAEGLGLGALGIGMPDIVLFLANLLKGIYEAALNYGFDYDSKYEQLLILKMMAAAFSTGSDWLERTGEIDALFSAGPIVVTEEEFQSQITKTASAFAMEMLVVKFIQGFPIVGILGGATNPIYYNKVMRYVQLAYRKRYFHKRISTIRQDT